MSARDLVRLLRKAFDAEREVDHNSAQVIEEAKLQQSLHLKPTDFEEHARRTLRLTQSITRAEDAAHAVVHEFLCLVVEEDYDPSCICKRMPDRCPAHKGASA